ncbi:hypothetical protein KC19_3G119400 [Ceratodon purpureus]|uniref:HTH three-helical bundle domain-containing protein n=1 Tax=Ceratodon purpureus TaxID=3225 RepID=A0A8T0IHF8_CERPU|nr:hypothetical protein KC19_3G119400 [Ceratodon purpureus]
MALLGFKRKMRNVPTGRVDLRNYCPERAILTPRDPNQVGHSTKGAELVGHSNQRAGFFQSQVETTKRTILSRSLHHRPKLAVTIKFPQSENFASAPGTCLNYTPRLSAFTSTGHVHAHTVEALSLLADVSCEVKRSYIQRSCNFMLPRSRGIHHRTCPNWFVMCDISWKKERSNQTPLQKKMASVLKNLYQLKEQCTDKHAQLKITDSYRVVRKLRTPRTPSLPAFRCPTKLQKNISLSKCDEIVSRKCGSTGWADAAHLRDSLALTDSSTINSASEDIMLGKGKFQSHNMKSLSSIGVPLGAQSTATLERVSKSSSQVSGTKKIRFGKSKRMERVSNQILKFIGEMPFPEKLIRQTLGNNPDTSKGLRLLLTERKVKRLGSGGRGRPFEYVVTEKGLLHIHGLKLAESDVVELTPESVSSCNPITGTRIVSDAPKYDAQCLLTQVTSSPEALASDITASQPYSAVTPQSSSPCPHMQIRKRSSDCELTTPLSSGITEC